MEETESLGLRSDVITDMLSLYSSSGSLVIPKLSPENLPKVNTIDVDRSKLNIKM